MKDYVHIGRIVATFGLKGEVLLKHALGKKTSLKGVNAIFIEKQKNSYLPYFIISSKIKDHDETYVQLEGVITKEAAQLLVFKNVWLPETDFRTLAAANSPIALLGFSLINEGINLGPIEEVIEQPHQVLLRITLNGNEALIPLHAETLLKIDRIKQELHVVLPDGLLEVYQ